MVYKVQDGIEFKTRSEWRNYMMLTYYSFHDVKNAQKPLIKPPGSIKGQMFDIINCENSELVVLDHCEQVHIDHVNDCRIFVGASASSITLNDCHNCTIYCCCNQLRVRNCIDCVCYVYSLFEIHVERSLGLQFACFKGGYPEHETHLIEANLFPISNNYWNSVYDDTPKEDKINGVSWTLLPTGECEEWFPGDKCEAVVPFTPVDDSKSDSMGKQRRGDGKKVDNVKHESSFPSTTTNINDAVSMKPSISSAGSGDRKTDVKKTPDQETRKGTISPTKARYLDEEEEERINQLGIEVALLVASARAKGINVSDWLGVSPVNKIIPVSDFNSRFIGLGLAVGIQEDRETKREIDFATSATSLAAIATICAAGFDDKGVSLINVFTFLQLAQAKVDRFLQQNDFDGDEQSYEDVKEEVKEVKYDSVKKIAQQEQQEDNEETKTLEEQVPEVVKPKEIENEVEKKEVIEVNDNPPVEEAKTFVPQITTSAEVPLPRKKMLSISLRSNSAPLRRSSASSSQKPIRVLSTSSHHLQPTSLEEMLMATLKQPDLYHVIQVHLGYIKPYIMNLARGTVVVSSPRSWISAYDMEKAFSAARLHLTTSQVFTIMNNVKEFATSTGLDPNRIIDNEREQESLEVSLKTDSVVLKHRVCAAWLKRYLVHLKLGDSARDWVTWLDQKLSNKEYRRSMKMTQSDKSKEFRKALAGISHSLNEDDIEDLLKNFEILSPEVLEQIVQQKLDSWELDTTGRRDFHHQVNLEYRKWSKEEENVAKMAGKSSKAKLEIEKTAKSDIRKKLLNDKKLNLLSSEKESAAITIEIFRKFDAENRKDNYETSRKFGDWLENYVRKENQHLKNFREDAKSRNKTFGARLVQSSWLGSLSYIEKLATKVIQTLKPPIQHERRRNLIAMRRQVQNDTRVVKDKLKARFLLVSKGDFNRFFDDSFLKLIEDQLSIDTNGEETCVFFKSKEDAAKCAHDFEKLSSSVQSKQFEEWLEHKKELEKSEASKKDKENLKKEQDENRRSIKARKAYKKWKKLHNKDKYYSRSDKKAKQIPEVLRASHNHAWRKELVDPIFEDCTL